MSAATPRLPRMLVEDRLLLLRRLIVFAWVMLAALVMTQIGLRAAPGFVWPEQLGFSATYNAVVGIFAVNTLVLTLLLIYRDWFERVPRTAESRVGWLLGAVLVWLGLHLFYAFHLGGGVHGVLFLLLPVLLIAALTLLPGRTGGWLAAYVLGGHGLVVALQQAALIHPTGQLAQAFAFGGPVTALPLIVLGGILVLAILVALHARRALFAEGGGVSGTAQRIDPETGLFRIGFLQARLTRELRRAARQDSASSLVVLSPGSEADGREPTPEQRLAMAHVLRQTVRIASDTPALFGPSALAVLLPATDRDAVEAFCRRLKEGFGESGLPTPHIAAVATCSRTVDATDMMTAVSEALAEVATAGTATPHIVTL